MLSITRRRARWRVTLCGLTSSCRVAVSPVGIEYMGAEAAYTRRGARAASRALPHVTYPATRRECDPLQAGRVHVTHPRDPVPCPSAPRDEIFPLGGRRQSMEATARWQPDELRRHLYGQPVARRERMHRRGLEGPRYHPHATHLSTDLQDIVVGIGELTGSKVAAWQRHIRGARTGAHRPGGGQ